MGKNIETAAGQQTAVLVAVNSNRQGEVQTKEYLDELEFLATTLDLKTLKKFTQNLESPDTKTFVGKGKLEEIKSYIIHHEVDVLVFDDELTPSQVRNLEREFEDKCKVLDRSLLILKIFMFRAKTAQAKTQVELAHYQYMLPRLTKMWTHLSRQKGGIGMRGGPGETELETDRRIIRDKVVLLKEKLKKIDKQNTTQRKSRSKMARVALVGYTNVGKSTLMRLISKQEIFAENKLFATVDSTVRKVSVGHIPFLLTDTVGFIRKLPTTLIESFKSTLSEIVEADILLHVIDISHESFEEQMAVVNNTLVEIGAADKPMILVFNKIDKYVGTQDGTLIDLESGKERFSLDQLKKSYLGNDKSAVFISAVERTNVKELRKVIFEHVITVHNRIFPNYTKDNSWMEYVYKDLDNL